MTELQNASLSDMRHWAHGLMAAREPDYVIGDNYLRRWWVVPRNEWCNVYLHEFRRSDEDRALHDHPWANTSFLISGSYIEHTPDGQLLRKPGALVERPATALHRIELIDGARAISLFVTGPKVRDWGFACPKGWVPWQQFTDPTGRGIGAGCGE